MFKSVKVWWIIWFIRYPLFPVIESNENEIVYTVIFLQVKCEHGNWLNIFCCVTGMLVLALCGYSGCCRPYHSSSTGDWDITPGEPGSDYPVLAHIPPTDFHCEGRSSGYYADVDTRCQVSTYSIIPSPTLVIPIIRIGLALLFIFSRSIILIVGLFLYIAS